MWQKICAFKVISQDNGTVLFQIPIIHYYLQLAFFSVWNKLLCSCLIAFQVKIHAEEMSESETAFMLEQGRLGIQKTGQQLGLLAGNNFTGKNS